MPLWLKNTEQDYRRWADACHARVSGWLPSDKNAVCLDLGSGPGNLLYLLRSAGYGNVTGVDISPDQVEIARRITARVERADIAEYLKQFSDSFDLITAFDLIEHLTKDELLGLLDAVIGALKPGGLLIVQTPNAESPWGLMHRYHDLTHEMMFDPEGLRHVLEVAGFTCFAARECGPYVHGWKSLGRVLVWKAIWTALAIWNLAETGSVGTGVYTRVFVAKAQKPTG